jgi:hypothetical protein
MNFHIHRRLVILVIILLVLVAISLGAVLVYKYSQIEPLRVINQERISRLARDHIQLGPNDVQMIASWMTFDYVNHVFGLPNDYLRSTFSINDTRYPHLALSRYAPEVLLAPDAFTSQIQTAVKNYFSLPQAR